MLESGVWIAPALGELLRPKTQLEITQTDTLVTVKDDAGWLRYLVLTGQTMREELGQGGPAIVVSKWEGGRLVTERSLGGEATYREVYRLEKPGVLRLDVEFRSARMPKPFRMRLEYDRSKAVNRE